MVKIRTRKETGKLLFDFQYQGIRCREQTTLDNSALNRKQMEAIAKKIDAAITLGQFNYADFFPQSKMVTKFEQRAEHLRFLTCGQSLPTVSTFNVQWFEEMLPAWRNSYRGSIESIFDKHILPVFGDKVC